MRSRMLTTFLAIAVVLCLVLSVVPAFAEGPVPVSIYGPYGNTCNIPDYGPTGSIIFYVMSCALGFNTY